MRTVILMIALVMFSQVVIAQTLEEWTQQKQTQIKYLVNQVVANKVYIEYIQKGYSIAAFGLTTISDIKNGEFKLHKDFFNSLHFVNPKIQQSVKVAAILALQIQIIKEAKQGLHHIRELDQFTTGELNHCTLVLKNLFNDCAMNMDELFMVITHGEVDMKDDERIKRIDHLYTEMQSKYSFNRDFYNQMTILAVQRIQEQAEINRAKILNQLK